ncbi:MAG: hypothetical protein KAV42_01420 [Candidatus Krumholzibacteria bacterium]|nr:hypothetical protein [Candidatus Krumholzibacteria bacterium]
MSGQFGNIIFDLSPAGITVGVILVLFSIYMYRSTYPPLGYGKKSILATLRILGFISLLVFIADPAIMHFYSEHRRPVIPVLIDISRSMEISDQNGRSRHESAIAVLRTIQSVFEDADLEVVGFSASTGRVSIDKDVFPDPSGEGSDIVETLEWAQSRFLGENVSGLVLLSDGRITDWKTPGDARYPAPVFVIGFGDTAEALDLRIDELVYESTIYTGTVNEIECILGCSGFPGGRIEIELLEDGNTVASASVDGKRGSGEIHATLMYKPGSEGDRLLSVRIKPLPGESIIENNNAVARMTVRKDKTRILYIDRMPDWNLPFIRTLVDRSERLEMAAVVWSPSRDYHFLSDRSAFDDTSDLSRYDLLIMGEGRDLFESQVFVGEVDRFVRSGGGVIFLGSEHSIQTSRNVLPELRQLLPFKVEGVTRIETGEFSLDASGSLSFSRIFSLIRSVAEIEALPPFTAMITGLEIDSASEAALTVDRTGRPVPALALKRVGEGVVASFSVFPLWQWKLAGENGARAYETLFSSLIEYLAIEKDLLPLRIQPGRPVYRAGEKIDLSLITTRVVEVGDVRGELFSIGSADSVPVETFLFGRSEGTGRPREAVIGPLPSGDYRVRARGISHIGESFQGETDFHVEPVSIEYLRTSRDQNTLKAIATLSGGRLLEGRDAGRLNTIMKVSADTVERSEVKPVSSKLILFMITLLLFSAEWAARKIWGLI